MTDIVVLNAEQRDIGSKHSTKLRAQGKLPAVVYGHKQEPQAIAVEYKALLEALHRGSRLFEMEVAGTKETVLVKDLQFDHYGIKVLHVDLMRVDLNEKAHVTVSVVLKGDAPGASTGIVETELDHIEMNCLVTAIPETLTVSIRELEIGSAIHVSDVELPDGAELLSDPEAVIVHCMAKRTLAATNEETEELQEPEMIREKKTEE